MDPAPLCGDGVLDPGEECDDNNSISDDGCDSTCGRDRFVYATSMEFSPDLIGGLSGADSLCKQLAHQADLPNWASYSAWLSDSKQHAVERIHHGRGRYLRTDNVLVAIGIDGIIGGSILNPISVDEFGDPVTNSAWTGTRPDGTAAPAASHCSDWTSDSFLDSGHFGLVESQDVNWTQFDFPTSSPITCATLARLYCFEGK